MGFSGKLFLEGALEPRGCSSKVRPRVLNVMFFFIILHFAAAMFPLVIVFLSLLWDWDIVGLLQRSKKAPCIEKLWKKSGKGVHGASRRRGWKNSKKSRKWLFFQVFFRVFWLVFRLFFDFFRVVLTPVPRGPGKPLFQTFFRSFSREGALFDPSKRPTMSQLWDAVDLGKLPEKWKFSNVVRRGCKLKRSFWLFWAQGSDFLFPLQPPQPPYPDKPPRPSPPRKAWFRSISAPFGLRFGPPFGSVWLRFGSVFRVRFRVLSGCWAGVGGGVWVGSGRGASVRQKNITSPGSRGLPRVFCKP